MHELSAAVAILYVHGLLSAAWTYFISQRVRPGLLRTTLLAPVVVLDLTLAPVLVDRHHYTFVVQGITCVLCTTAFKVLPRHSPLVYVLCA